MANPFLHEDILTNIFLRLPEKSVGKFRCLSKIWRTNLCTSQFINLHLRTRKAKQPKLFLKKKYVIWFSVSTLPIHDRHATITSKIELPTATHWCAVVDSCNGLVLLLNAQRDMFLVNPVTLEHVKVSVPSCVNSEKLFSFRCGFGYDSCSDDYKIVYLYEKDHGMILEVYSVKSKVWKRVNSSPGCSMGGYRGIFTNGAIHWVSNSNVCPSRIVAFNLADEVFYDIPSPTFKFYRVYVIEGCLCVVDRLCNDVWIMKEYGVADSWTKFNINSNGKWEVYRPLCFIGDEEIVFATFDNRVIVYNLVEGTARDMVVDGDTTDGVAFFDSLVSPSSDQHVFV